MSDSYRVLSFVIISGPQLRLTIYARRHPQLRFLIFHVENASPLNTPARQLGEWIRVTRFSRLLLDDHGWLFFNGQVDCPALPQMTIMAQGSYSLADKNGELTISGL
ncbi:MAG: hypothetical protein C3F02_01850 [Parcubacteria group bacterium]|nr:MAG: hypothetical protein C3F02_01850 [Parcubacteria group bacterium]